MIKSKLFLRVHTPFFVAIYSSLTPYYVSWFSDLEGLLSSSLDAKLVPEHLLRLCLEHDQKFSLSHKTVRAYNFYKVPILLLRCIYLLYQVYQTIYFSNVRILISFLFTSQLGFKCSCDG